MSPIEKTKEFPLEKTEFKIKVDTEKVKRLIKSNKFYKNELPLLKELAKHEVYSYKLKNPLTGWGRYSNSKIMTLSRQSRHYIFGEDYYDFDIVNSQPSIMLAYFNSQGFETKKLKQYVSKRDIILQDVIEEFNIIPQTIGENEDEYSYSAKDIAKELFTSICNLGSIGSWLTKFSYNIEPHSYYYALHTEMSMNIEKAKKIETELWNDTIKINKNIEGKFLEGSFASYLYRELERRIIEPFFDTNMVYAYDGIMIPKEVFQSSGKTPEQFIENFQAYISQKFSSFKDIKMINKPMDEAWEINEVDEVESKDKRVCSNDKEASDYLFDRLNNKLVYCDGVLYYKNGNYWISNKTELENVLLVLVLHSDIYKQDKKGEYVAYAQNVSSAKRIVEAIVARAYEKKDDSFYSKFHTSMKGKLCFNNGVFDFPTKTFTLWEDLKEEVFATFGITYDYSPIRNELVIQEVKEKVFKAIFEADHEQALSSFSRGMAGHYTDKNWIMFQGNRDCGKGVLDGFFKSTFQNYTTSLSNDNFLYERNSGESEASKKWGWAMALEFARICFTQESKTDNTNKNLKLDGTKIKGIASGGDNMKGRQLYENTRNFMVEALLVMCGNDFPPVSPADAMETCITLSSIKQFKSESFIQERKEDNASQFELSCYVVADPTIKDKCSSPEWRTALMHILSDFYSSTSVKRVNHFAEDSNEANPISKILNDFELTTNEKDKVSNEDLKEWSLEHNISLAKMKQILKSFKCKDYKSGSKRGLSGLLKKLVESKEESKEEKSL